MYIRTLIIGASFGQGSLGPHFFGDLLSDASPQSEGKQSGVQVIGTAGNEGCETNVVYGQCLLPSGKLT